MIPVRFLEKCPPYNAGDVAGFEPTEAARLIDRGVAERYQVEKPTKKPAPKRRRGAKKES